MSNYLVTRRMSVLYGSHLVSRLHNDGHTVVVIDDLSTGFREYLPRDNYNIYFQPKNINDLINENFLKIDGVFHVAGFARIQPSLTNPMAAYQTNVMGTLAVLEFMRKMGIKNIVYSASSSSYRFKS